MALFNWLANMAVDSAGGADTVFGTKPEVADFVPIDLSAETGKAVEGNLANYDSITELLNKIIPGFSDILAQGSENTLAELQGQLPPDVIAQIQRSSAFQSLMGGFSGTGMSKALTARDLGLSSLNLTEMGKNSAQVWSKYAEEAYSPFTVSTGQQAATTAANNAGRQAQEQFQFNVDAAPDPGAAGIFGVQTALGMQAASIGGAFAGGGMSGGGSSGGGTGLAPAPSNWQLIGGQGSSAAYQYNPATGQFQSVPQAQGAWSDRRLKENIVHVGVSPNGHKVYEFNYLGQEGRWVGVMAVEVPFAARSVDGYLRVDYSLLDVEFRRAA